MDRSFAHAIFNVERLTAFLTREFPANRAWTDVQHRGRRADDRAAAPPPPPQHLRPGGTISGPTIFALADVALYVAILAQIGEVKHAVTTNLNINFLRKPAPPT